MLTLWKVPLPRNSPEFLRRKNWRRISKPEIMGGGENIKLQGTIYTPAVKVSECPTEFRVHDKVTSAAILRI